MKKYLALLLLLAMAAAPCALAEDAATPLPCGVTFEMDGEAVAQAVGNGASFAPYYAEEDSETGCVQLADVELGVGGLTADYVTFEVERNNSPREPRLCLISASLPIGDSSVAAFRAALAALTEVYGEPESDPFDEHGVEVYVEYGSLDASWVKEDVRISLSMQRMYGESLNLSFAPRICFDASDLEA